VKEENDPILEIAQVANDYMLQGAVPGAFLVDALPFLKYVPNWFPGEHEALVATYSPMTDMCIAGAGFKRYGAIGQEKGDLLRDVPFAKGKEAIVSIWLTFGHPHS